MYGSRISLISRRNIRYIGTLNDVNEAEKTISLEHVCSMGTEGRTGDPQSEIPPCDDIYEYIQFRATDVLSVQFESETQAPPPPPPPQVPNDPAILEVDNQHRSSGYANRGGYVPRGGRGGYVPRGGANTWRGGRGGRGGYQARHNSGRPVEIPESDFDFESSNSKLNKDDLAKEFAKLNVQFSDNNSRDVAAPAASASLMAEPSTSSSVAAATSSGNTGTYTQKSFFDDISCEAKERMQMQEFGLSYEERRNRIHAERQQNYETFGQATSDQAQLRYNRFQNSRGRGGAGAPNGYYHNTSNPNYNSNGSNWRGGRGGRGGYQRGGYRNQQARDLGSATEAST
ncbi:hypothetical protein IWW37_006044 [Coemansia sp. RSA 2050]|nr:hypothetical protein IWW37_006044 [Coemansia sp. RSA 2050]